MKEQDINSLEHTKWRCMYDHIHMLLKIPLKYVYHRLWDILKEKVA